MTGVISVSKAIMLPLQGELWHVFSFKQQTEIESILKFTRQPGGQSDIV